MIVRLARGFSAVLCILLLMSCGGPEQKKAKFYNKGKALFEKGEIVKSRLEFRNALQIDPKFADAYYMLGMVESRQQNLKGAYGAFSKAVELDPKHFKARYQLGRLFLAVREPDKAMEKAEAILKEAPGDEDAMLLKGAALVARKDIGAARGYLKGIIGKGIMKPDAYELLAAANLQSGNVKDAEEALRNGIVSNGGSVALHRALADLLVRTNRPDDAAAEVRKIIGLEPENIDHRLALAGLYGAAGKEPQAREVLQQIIAADRKKEENWIRVAQFHLQGNRPADAESTLREGIKANDRSYRLRFALGELYMKLDRSGDAVAVLKECVGFDRSAVKPEAILARNALARVHLQRQEIGDAEKYADEVIKESPKNVEAHDIKGGILLGKGDGPNAVSEFRTVVAEAPLYLDGYVRLAEAHVLNRELKLGEDTLQNALKDNPDSPVLRRALGRFHVMKKEFGKGEEQYRSLLAKNPDDLETRAALGDLYMASGDRARAGSEYESIRKKAPAIPIGYVKLAELYQSQGKWDRAAAEMEQAARLNPRADAILASLVQIRLQQKRPEAAAALLEARGKQNPNDAFVRYLLGQVRAAQGDNRKAEESFLRAMELSPENVAPYLSLAQLYTRNREYAKAIPVYEKVLARQPDHWAAANDLAFLLCEGDASGKDLDRALNLAERARRLRPEEGTVLDTMGWIYHRKGDFQKAVDLLQRVQAKAPDSPIANYHLGMALAGAGKREQAREMLRKSLAAKVDFPGREDARKALEKL